GVRTCASRGPGAGLREGPRLVPEDAIGADLALLALYRLRPQRLALEEVLHLRVGVLPDHDPRRVGHVALEPRGQVDGVAEHAVVLSLGGPDVPLHHPPAVAARAELDLGAVAPLGVD